MQTDNVRPDDSLPSELLKQLGIIDQSQWYILILAAATLLSYCTTDMQKQLLLCSAQPEENACDCVADPYPIQLTSSAMIIGALIYFYQLAGRRAVHAQRNASAMRVQPARILGKRPCARGGDHPSVRPKRKSRCGDVCAERTDSRSGAARCNNISLCSEERSATPMYPSNLSAGKLVFMPYRFLPLQSWQYGIRRRFRADWNGSQRCGRVLSQLQRTVPKCRFDSHGGRRGRPHRQHYADRPALPRRQAPILFPMKYRPCLRSPDSCR